MKRISEALIRDDIESTARFDYEGIRGGANPLNAQLEFVGVGGAREGFVEGDELLGVEVKERLIEGLHSVLAGAGGDGVVDQARFVRVDNAIADVTGGD